MNKDELFAYLEIMCDRCINHDVCHGTWCGPKKEIRKYIDKG